jgi:hypothetical protein
MVLELRCPTCGRKVTVDAARVATTVVRRTCSRGHRWMVVVTPLKDDGQMTFHKVEWNPRADARWAKG